MRRQRNRPQIEEQENAPEEELNKTDLSNILDIVFNKYAQQHEKDIETMRSNLSEMKNDIP